MLSKVDSATNVTVDTTIPGGVLGKSLNQGTLSHLCKKLEFLQSNENAFKIEKLSPALNTIKSLSKRHFGYPYRETHCFRGYPIHGSIRQFHENESDYILHLDCDMLFFEEEHFSWIKEGIRLMNENEDLLCVLPRGGPPTRDGELYQGDNKYKKDEHRRIFLFKNFTSRHYLIHRKRFLSLLPMTPTWLSWREPIKSRFFGNGKMLCWENTVQRAIENSTFWRADLMSEKAWSLHPGDRCERFHKKIPTIAKQVSTGHFPIEQAGHFDLMLNDW